MIDAPSYGWLRYSKGTNFQANHNWLQRYWEKEYVGCDIAKVRIFKQITTDQERGHGGRRLVAI